MFKKEFHHLCLYLSFQMLFRVLSPGSIGTCSAFGDTEKGLYYMAYLEPGHVEKILLHNSRVSVSYSCIQTCLKGWSFITCGNDSIKGNTVYYQFNSVQ